MLDNFDRIIENITEDSNILLKEILTNYDNMIIIAASTRIDEHFWQYDKPFYHFFRPHHLETLTIDEINKLLNHWADTANMPELKAFVTNNLGKLQNIRIITDGLPRTFQFFIQLVVQNDYANEGVDYLKKIMDNVTPMYQERLNNLPPQLRKIVLEMAFIWEACNTKKLVTKCKMKSKLISANLKTLADKGIVSKIETDKRNLLYRISERFFNIWLIMTQGSPEQKQKTKCLNIFLENWYDAGYLKTVEPKNVFEIKERLFIPNEIQNNKKTLELSNLVENKNDGFDFFDLGTIDRVQAIYSEAENYYLLAIEKGQVGAMFNLGNLYTKKGRFEEAENYYLLAIERGHIGAMYNLGLLYTNQERFEEAEKYYILAIERGQISALYNLGLLYANQSKFEEAKKYYLLAIEKGQVSAMSNLGNIYASQGKLKEAEKYYLSAIKKEHVNAIYNLANLYANQSKFEEAEKYYLSAIEKGHIAAMSNLGNLYVLQGKFKKAENYYLSAMEKGDVNAMYHMGIIYDNQGKYKKAENCYLHAMEKNHNTVSYNLASLYYRQNRKKADTLEYIRRYEKNDVLRIIIDLWNGIFEDVEKRTLAVIKESNALNWFIIELLIHQQKELVLNLFIHSEVSQMLQDKLKVLYYVCLLLNKKTQDNLILKIPPEIQTTIDEVINYITEKEKFYGYGE
jgi:TPR repeat protein